MPTQTVKQQNQKNSRYHKSLNKLLDKGETKQETQPIHDQIYGHKDNKTIRVKINDIFAA
jgi:hypothetical protein